MYKRWGRTPRHGTGKVYNQADTTRLWPVFGPVEMACETYGSLSETRDNVVLILHALTGDAHVAGSTCEYLFTDCTKSRFPGKDYGLEGKKAGLGHV